MTERVEIVRGCAGSQRLRGVRPCGQHVRHVRVRVVSNPTRAVADVLRSYYDDECRDRNAGVMRPHYWADLGQHLVLQVHCTRVPGPRTRTRTRTRTHTRTHTAHACQGHAHARQELVRQARVRHALNALLQSWTGRARPLSCRPYPRVSRVFGWVPPCLPGAAGRAGQHPRLGRGVSGHGGGAGGGRAGAPRQLG